MPDVPPLGQGFSEKRAALVPPLRQGSPEKRAAIVRAALDVFVSEGYQRASVDVIARAAGVSKRTIYDYYGDKERLFLAAIKETSAAQEETFKGLLTRTLGSAEDDIADEVELESRLIAFGVGMAAEVAHGEERAAVMRLLIAEGAHFPALLEPAPEERPVQRALAGRLAELGTQGLLDIPDPAEAAEFLALLIIARVGYRSWYGTVRLDEPEIVRLVESGVRVFLRAYGPKRAWGACTPADAPRRDEAARRAEEPSRNEEPLSS